jgi:outer membrane protein W
MKQIFLAAFLCLPAAFAQQQELGLTLGHILANELAVASGSLDLSGGTALQANYGLRVYKGSAVTVYFETHFLANGLREIASPDSRVSRDVATAYVTPGVRVRFAPNKAVQPYVVFGGGYALYEQSKTTLAGNPNPALRFTHGTTIAFGSGVDAKLWRFIGLRAEVRDFYSGNPTFNIEPSSSRQHNVVIGGGFVLRFGEDR